MNVTHWLMGGIAARVARFVRHQDGPFCMKERVAGHMGDIPMPLGLLRPFKARPPPALLHTCAATACASTATSLW